MSKVTVKSKNQSGGITAQNVSGATQFDVESSTKKDGPWRRVFWWIFGVAGVVSAVAAVIAIW